MRAPTALLFVALCGCVAQTAPHDTVLVDRRGAPPPRDPLRRDPLPREAAPTEPADTGSPVPVTAPLPVDGVTLAAACAPVVPTIVSTAPGLRLRVVAQWTRDDLVPFQSWRDLPGHLLGVVWMAGPQAWGAGYEHWASPSLETSRDEYKFGVDGTSPYAVYFVSDGRGYNFLPRWTGGGRGAYDAAMFDCETPNGWGLTRRAHLVDIEVNGGQGAPVGIHFVVTDARVADGTATFPPRIDALLLGLRQRFDAAFADERAELEGLYRNGMQRMGRAYVFGAPTIEPIGVFPTWLRATQSIEVVFTSSISGLGLGATTTELSSCPECPPGAPCVECNVFAQRVTQTASVTVSYAIRYRVDARGLVVAETRYAGRLEATRGAQRDGGRFGN